MNNSTNKRKIVLELLSFLSISCPIVCIFFVWIYMYVKNVPAEFFHTVFWMPLVFLFIPVLSIILGTVYKKKGIKRANNIKIGYIVIVILLLEISIMYKSGNEFNYNEINVYSELIKVELPSYGKFNRSGEENEEYVFSTFWFTNEKEATKFYSSIKENNSWFSQNKLSSKLKVFVPVFLGCYDNQDNCYYSVYIDELQEHNIVPKESGTYHITAMLYDPNICTLKIIEYEYDYKS